MLVFFGITMQEANVVSDCERGQQRLAPYCSQVRWAGGRCSVYGHKQFHPNASASRSELYSSRDHTRPLRLPFALPVDSHHERTTIPEITSFDWNEIFAPHVKGYWYGELLTLRSIVGQNQWWTQCTAVVGSARIGRVLDTRQSFSDKDDDIILHTHFLCRTTREALGH